MNRPSPVDVAIIGGGPAGLMAAEQAVLAGSRVTLFDAMPSPGRKFLVAGRGGLNLTHSEPLDKFVTRYGAQASHYLPLLKAFGPTELRQWADTRGAATFVGTSGRVFPKGMQAAALLRQWVRSLKKAGVTFLVRHRWTGWSPEGHLVFETPGGTFHYQACATVLALGGASWPQTGSTGSWVPLLQERGIQVHTLESSNCGFIRSWSSHFMEKSDGTPLKNLRLTAGTTESRGDLVITSYGMEGGGLYPLCPILRHSLNSTGQACLNIDFKPDHSKKDLIPLFQGKASRISWSVFFRKTLRLAPAVYPLLHEIIGPSIREASAEQLASGLKSLPVTFTGIRPIDEAISTAGGVSWDELDEHLMLKKMPGTYIAGEMLDSDPPTGGYLLQGAFSSGFTAGRAAAR